MCSDGDYDKYDGLELSTKKSFDSNTNNKTKYAFKHLLLKRKADRKKKDIVRKNQRRFKESRDSDERKVPLKDATKKANKKVVVKAKTDDKSLAKAKAKSQAKAKSKEKAQSEKKDQSQSQKKAQAHAHKK